MKKKSPVAERTKLLNLIMEKGYSLKTRELLAAHFKNLLEVEREDEARNVVNMMNSMSEEGVVRALISEGK